MIVAISGLDGAGKSTQIDLLSKSLSAKGVRVRFLWARGGYTPGFEFIKKILRIVLGKKAFPSGQSKQRENKLKNPFVRTIWLSLAIFDLCIFWGLYIRIFDNKNSVVICDRYLNDTLLDFRRNFPNVDLSKSYLWKLLVFITPKPDVSFLFWIPVSTSLERSIAKNEPFPDNKETLEWRLENYLNEVIFPAQIYNRIDGREDVNKIAKQVLSTVNSNF